MVCENYVPIGNRKLAESLLDEFVQYEALIVEYWRQSSRRWKERVRWYTVSPNFATCCINVGVPRIRAGGQGGHGGDRNASETRADVQGPLHLKNRGRSDPPVFMEVDSRGTWSQKKGKLYWKADDGSTETLEVIAQEKADELIAKEWYRQDTPAGIPSLHKWLTRHYLGLSRPQVRRFVEKQKTWLFLSYHL